jgi:hypothetical protein
MSQHDELVARRLFQTCSRLDKILMTVDVLKGLYVLGLHLVLII